MYLLIILLAAISFAVGGVFMKLSEGLSQLLPSLLVYFFFAAGATLQTIAMRKSELGVTYLFVLGLESVLAFWFGVFFFKEDHSALKILGINLVVSGIMLLHAGDT